VAYLTQSLSADVIPVIAERLPSLPDPQRTEIRDAVRKRFAARFALRRLAWFEWNLASVRARRAMDTSFASP
jgi:hypothetical protein